jgi:hypothetical protein
MDMQDIAGPSVVVASKGKTSDNESHNERTSMKASSGTRRSMQAEAEVQVPLRSAARNTRSPVQTTYGAKERSTPAPEPPRHSECWTVSIMGMSLVLTLFAQPVEKRSTRSHVPAEADDLAPSPKRRREAEPESETSSRVKVPEANRPRKARNSTQSDHGAKNGNIVVGLPPDSDEEDLTAEERDMREVRNDPMLKSGATEH